MWYVLAILLDYFIVFSKTFLFVFHLRSKKCYSSFGTGNSDQLRFQESHEHSYEFWRSCHITVITKLRFIIIFVKQIQGFELLF